MGFISKLFSRMALGGVKWEANKELLGAISSIDGILGVRFRLAEVTVGELGDLELLFQTENYIQPQDKIACEYALRCFVGLTFPNIASTVNGLKVSLVSEYRVRLGSGIKIAAFSLIQDAEQVGPFQMTSAEEDGKWSVYVAPLVVATNPYAAEKTIISQKRIFEKVIGAFEPLKQMDIILSGIQ